jgi:nitroreductase
MDLETVDKLLSTTRAVRKRLDLVRPVPIDVIVECLRLAVQAPTGSNMQTWRWVVVTDSQVRNQIAELYRNPPPVPVSPTQLAPDLAGLTPILRDSAEHLLQHLQDVPVLVVPCVQDIGGAAGWAPSIYPAVWSFMLALRSRGLGSVITTAHLFRREEADALLGVPPGYVQSCLVPVAYYTGTDFRPAARRPVEELTFLNRWGTPVPSA